MPDSELWNVVEEAFADDIREMYYTMRQRGILSYDRMMRIPVQTSGREMVGRRFTMRTGTTNMSSLLLKATLTIPSLMRIPRLSGPELICTLFKGSRELYGKWDMEKPLPVSRQ